MSLRNIFKWMCLLFSMSSFAGQPLNIVLDWIVNPNHVPLILAIKNEKLNAKLITPSDPGGALKLLLANQADIVITYQANLVIGASKNLPIVRIASLFSMPLSCVLTNNPKIKKITDLQNKTVAFSESGFSEVVFASMMKLNHVENVNLINVNYDLMPALIMRKVDAVNSVMRNVEPLELKFKSQEYTVFYPEDYGVPSYDELIFIVRQSSIHDPRLKIFLNKLKKAISDIKADPNKSWNEFIEDYPAMNNKMDQAIWEKTWPLFSDDPEKFDGEKYQGFASFLYNQKLIKKIPSLKEYTIKSDD